MHKEITMELLFLVIIVGVGGWLAYNHFNRKAQEESKPEAPYKIESPDQPSWHTAPAENIKPVTLTDVLDVNKDGKVDIADVKEAVKKTRTRVKKSADVDGDGKVTAKDAKAAVAKVTKRRRTNSKKA
jgi:cytoskeletal protein RodZ